MRVGLAWLLSSTIAIVACVGSRGAEEAKVISTLVSPDGAVTAELSEADTEFGELTLVMLNFNDGCGGSSAVSAYRLDAGLELRWVDASTLEVRHPSGLPMERNASGEVIRCRAHEIKVILTPVE